MNVTVIGAGKMGLPLACQFASKGAKVVVCDINARLIEAVNRGDCLIDEPGVAELLQNAVQSGYLRGTTDTPSAVTDSEVVVVIVPVLLTPDKKADVSIIEGASRQIAEGLKPGMMISYETTLPVGTTRCLVPILESSGLTAGRDFDVVFSPERVKSQFVLECLAGTPKVVGGLTPPAAKRAAAFYADYLGAPVINVGSLEAAEMVKLAGMAFRDVSIALSNELARYAEAVGVDFHTVMKAANTNGEANLLTPGIGVGGHCTPVYPYFLIQEGHKLDVPFGLTERARCINDEQPSYMLDRLERVWGPVRGSTVLILGLGFRPQVKEHTLSPAFQLRDELLKRGAEVRLDDPLYTENEIQEHGFVPGVIEQMPSPEIFILNTAHQAYANVDFRSIASRGAKVVVDGRGLWQPETVCKAGLVYIGVGQPAESSKPSKRKAVPIARPYLGIQEAEATARVVCSGWVTQGPQVEAFEREFAESVGAPYACAVSSCTTALHLALLAVGARSGDEVVTVSHSYIATANSIRYCGATPVFVDIQPETFNIDSMLAEQAITDRTRVILCVHQMGMPCDLKAILEIAQRHSLPVIEDAACAIGSEVLWKGRWEKIGKPHGDIACFSFHPRKVITTGDGGMLTTSHAEWDRQFRLWRQHGMSAPDTTRHSSKEVVFESYPTLGYNYRMTDLQAAVGREQLKRLPDILERRRYLANRYKELLGSLAGIGLPTEPEWARSNWQSYCVRLPERCDQRQVMQFMLDRGVASRRGIMCSHREQPYLDVPQCSSLSASEQAQDRCVILPLYHQMTEEDQNYVVEVLRKACQPL